MPWVRFDDQYPIHRKVETLSDAAFRLHTAAIFWCARNLTDGRVSTVDLDSVAPKKMRRPEKFVVELVERGVWHEPGQACGSPKCPLSTAPVDGGWVLHDYFDYQPTKAKVTAEREAKAERQRRWMENQKRRASDASKDGTSQRKDASQDGTVDASRDSAPYPPRPEKGGGGDAPERASPPGRPPTGAASIDFAARACRLCDSTGQRWDPVNKGRGTVGTCDHQPLPEQETA